MALSELVSTPNVAELRRHALHEAERLDALAGNGWDWLRTFLACSGSMREWFGVPWWAAHVEVFVSDVTDSDSWLSRLYTARALAEPAAGARRARHRAGDGPRAPISRGAGLARR